MKIIVRAWPLELVNGEPLDAARTQAHVDALRDQVAPELFRGFDAAHFPASTLDALALAAHAYRTDTTIGERVSFMLRDALFEEGRDISDPAVLRAIAQVAQLELPDQLDREAVLADWHDGRERGVLGSPHFFCGGADVFCPSLTITHALHGLSITRDTSRLETFFDQCFARSEGGPVIGLDVDTAARP